MVYCYQRQSCLPVQENPFAFRYLRSYSRDNYCYISSDILMKDQVDALISAGIPGTFINSSLSYSEINERLCKAEKGIYKILYIAPERLESEDFCELLKRLDVSFAAIDEAHCVSQWGHDFRPSYRLIGKLIGKFGRRPVVAGFTAAATEEVKEDIIGLLLLNYPNVYVTGFDRENLFFSVYRDENKNDFILKYIEYNRNQPGNYLYGNAERDRQHL